MMKFEKKTYPAKLAPVSRRAVTRGWVGWVCVGTTQADQDDRWASLAIEGLGVNGRGTGVLKSLWVAEIRIPDRRHRSGDRLLLAIELNSPTEPRPSDVLDCLAIARAGGVHARLRLKVSIDDIKIKIQPKYVTRKNLMSGKEFLEHYDTPYTCSPSSETYWSN